MSHSPTAQRIVIPKGLINPDETTVVEIPEDLQNVGTVVALPKEGQSPPRQPYNLPGPRQVPDSPPSPPGRSQRSPRKLVKKRSYTKKLVPCSESQGDSSRGYDASGSGNSGSAGSPFTSANLTPGACTPCNTDSFQRTGTPDLDVSPLTSGSGRYKMGFDTQLSLYEPQYNKFEPPRHSTFSRRPEPGYSPIKGQKEVSSIPAPSSGDSEISSGWYKFCPYPCSSKIPEPSYSSMYDPSGLEYSLAGTPRSGYGSSPLPSSIPSSSQEGRSSDPSYQHFNPTQASSRPWMYDSSGSSGGKVDPSMVESLGKLEEEELSSIMSDLNSFQQCRRKLILDAASLKSAADFTLSSLEDTGGMPSGGLNSALLQSTSRSASSSPSSQSSSQCYSSCPNPNSSQVIELENDRRPVTSKPVGHAYQENLIKDAHTTKNGMEIIDVISREQYRSPENRTPEVVFVLPQTSDYQSNIQQRQQQYGAYNSQDCVICNGVPPMQFQARPAPQQRQQWQSHYHPRPQPKPHNYSPFSAAHNYEVHVCPFCQDNVCKLQNQRKKSPVCSVYKNITNNKSKCVDDVEQTPICPLCNQRTEEISRQNYSPYVHCPHAQSTSYYKVPCPLTTSKCSISSSRSDDSTDSCDQTFKKLDRLVDAKLEKMLKPVVKSLAQSLPDKLNKVVIPCPNKYCTNREEAKDDKDKYQHVKDFGIDYKEDDRKDYNKKNNRNDSDDDSDEDDRVLRSNRSKFAATKSKTKFQFLK